MVSVSDTITVTENLAAALQSSCGCIAEIDAWVATVEARLDTIDAAFAANLAAINAYASDSGQVQLINSEAP